MEWHKEYFGNSGPDEIYVMSKEAGDLPDGSFFAVSERTGQWLLVRFDRGGGNRLVSRHISREEACQEAERLLLEANLPSAKTTEEYSVIASNT
jgi:hypothetical protein